MKKNLLFFAALAFCVLIFSCEGGTNSSSQNGEGENSSQNQNPSSDEGGTNSNGGTGVDFEIHNAKATYYDYTDTVATGISKVPSGVYKCAMHEDTLNAGYEGACIEITGPLGTIKAVVVDCLPRTDSGVQKGDIDIMTSDTFSKIANVSDGRVSITWKMTSLPTSGPIEYQMQGNNQWWIGIRPQNQKFPIAKIEVNVGGSWKAMGKKTEGRCYNYYFMQNDSGFSSPLKIRVTSVTGTVIEDTLSSFAAKTTVKGTKNF